MAAILVSTTPLRFNVSFNLTNSRTGKPRPLPQVAQWHLAGDWWCHHRWYLLRLGRKPRP